MKDLDKSSKMSILRAKMAHLPNFEYEFSSENGLCHFYEFI